MNMAVFAGRLRVERTFKTTGDGIGQKIAAFAAKCATFQSEIGQGRGLSIKGTLFAIMVRIAVDAGKKSQNLQVLYFPARQFLVLICRHSSIHECILPS